MKNKIIIPNQFCENYKNNIQNTVEIAKELNISDSTVMRYFKANNIVRNYCNKEWLQNKYNKERLSISEIAKQAKSNNKTINKYLKKFDIIDPNYSIRSKKYSYNLNFFNNIITIEKAYWLGFLYADGGLDSSCYRLSFKLSKTDYEHLEKIKNLLCPENIIVFSQNYDERTKKTYYRANLAINNMTIFNQLIKIGCLPGKKHEYKVPNLPENLISHFIRGYFDGDGSVSISNNCLEMNIVGGKNILEFIAQQLENIIYKKIQVIKVKDKNLYRIGWGGNIICDAVMHYLYKDATSICYLERKYNKWYKHFINQNKRYSLIFAEMQRTREKLPSPTL